MDRSLKLILTLLALVTGFAAAPAQARMCAADPAEFERIDTTPRGGVSAIEATIAEYESHVAQRQRRDRELGRPRPTVSTVVIPSIQLGDRARQ